MRAKTSFIALIILPVFLTTNSIYANSFKLAAPTQAGGLGMLSGELRIPADLLDGITARKIADLKTLRLEEEKIKGEVIGKYRAKRDSHEITEGEFQQIERDIRDSLSFISTDSEGKVVIYLFNRNKPYFYRILRSDTQVVDKFYEAFISPEDRVGETINIDGCNLEVYEARMDRLDGINRCLYKLYGSGIRLAVPDRRVPVRLVGQDCEHLTGAFTAYVNLDELKRAGANGVLLGHSEVRKYRGETDERVNNKLKAALACGMRDIIVCVGEGLNIRYPQAEGKNLGKEKRKAAKDYVLEQIRKIFEGISDKYASSVVIAYEPLWAIAGSGLGITANLEQVSDIHEAIRDEIARLYNRDTADSIRIIYGGSVKQGRGTPEEPKAEDLAGLEDVDGFLIGSVSVDAKAFRECGDALQKAGTKNGRKPILGGNFKLYPLKSTYAQFVTELRRLDYSIIDVIIAPAYTQISEFNRVLSIPEIRHIRADTIFDSRMKPTVGIEVILSDGTRITAKVPSGASTGEKEAIELRDGMAAGEVERGLREWNNDISNAVFGKAVSKDDAIALFRKDPTDVKIAVYNINYIIVPAILKAVGNGELDILDQEAVDRFLLGLEARQKNGDPIFKKVLGANAILAVSMAIARVASHTEGLELYEYLSSGREYGSPYGTYNVLNGGKHADNNVDIQETQIVPIAGTARERNIIARRVYAALLALLKKKGLNTNVGDEGGFAPKVKSNEEYLRLLEEAIKNVGYEPGTDVAIALDPAASEFSYKVAGKIVYVLRGESAPIHIGDGQNIGRIQKGTDDDGRPYDGLVLTTEEMSLYWEYLISKYPILSIEDGFSEHDALGFRLLTKAVAAKGIRVMGDDITVTNIRFLRLFVEGSEVFKRIDKDTIEVDGLRIDLSGYNTPVDESGNRYIEPNTINSILIKLNQIGSITETIEVIRYALNKGVQVSISHRSGETEDTTISDLAYTATTFPKVDTEGRLPMVTTKFGAGARSERGAKYNRNEEIERDIKRKAAGAKHGPIAKKVRQGEPETNIWEAGLREGKLVDAVVHNTDMAKKVDTGMLQKVLDAIGEFRGPGIFLGVDVIRVVDNLQEGQVEGIVPFTMIKQEGDKRVLLLDVDSFKDAHLLYLLLDHELIEGIMTLIPYENEGIRELTSNYMSVLTGLLKNAAYISDVDSLDPDNRFIEVVRTVQERGLVENRKAIISLLLEHMRTTPYYKDLARQLGVTAELAGQIDAAEDRFAKALEVFNSIAEALVPKVEKTEVMAERLIKMAGKLKMVTSQLISKEIGLVDALVREGKYIRLDVDELEKHPELLGWIKGLLGKKDTSPFIFYSSSGKQIPVDLRQADVKEMTQQNTITLIEPEKITADMPQDTLYLPLPYARSTVYLASEVVLAGGVVDNIDKLAKNTIESLYSALLGRDVTDTDLEQLFKYPWTILPEIASISATLDAIRTAIARIEAAA